MIVLQPVSLRPRRWPAFIPAFLAILMLAFIPTHGDRTSLYLFCEVLAAISAVKWWTLGKWRIDLDPEGITQKTLFTNYHIEWSDLVECYIGSEYHNMGRGLYWNFISGHGPNIRFTVGMYNQASLRQLAEAAVNYSPFAIQDKRIQKILEGRFSKYYF